MISWRGGGGLNGNRKKSNLVFYASQQQKSKTLSCHNFFFFKHFKTKQNKTSEFKIRNGPPTAWSQQTEATKGCQSFPLWKAEQTQQTVNITRSKKIKRFPPRWDGVKKKSKKIKTFLKSKDPGSYKKKKLKKYCGRPRELRKKERGGRGLCAVEKGGKVKHCRLSLIYSCRTTPNTL